MAYYSTQIRRFHLGRSFAFVWQKRALYLNYRPHLILNKKDGYFTSLLKLIRSCQKSWVLYTFSSSNISNHCTKKVHFINFQNRNDKDIFGASVYSSAVSTLHILTYKLISLIWSLFKTILEKHIESKMLLKVGG